MVFRRAQDFNDPSRPRSENSDSDDDRPRSSSPNCARNLPATTGEYQGATAVRDDRKAKCLR